MSFAQVKELNIRTFWLLHGNIDRVRADSELRQMRVASAAASPEGFTEHQKRLMDEVGKIDSGPPSEQILNAPRDRDGIAALKALSGR